jgi:6-phosphogluconolactonase
MKKLVYLFAMIISSLTAEAQQADYHLVIGTYTIPGKSEGIYVYDFNTSTAELKQVSVQKNVINPSFLTVTADKRFIYAVNEDGAKSMVSAFGFDANTGKISFLNQQKVDGADPCYLIADDHHVITANYTGGSISVYGRDRSGALTQTKQLIRHTGSSIDKARQESAHVHMVRFTPDHKYVVCNDLGEDKVKMYAYDKEADENVLTLKDSISVKPGSGPRHIVFGFNGKYAYLIQEMQGDLTAFSYHDGTLKKIQETSMVDKDFKGENGGSDIQLSADGKFLYAANRGTANTITTFAIGKDGKLSKIGQVSTNGINPRAFTIDPSGNWLLAGHQTSNDIVIFKRNKITGQLTDTGKKIEIGAPVCFVFVPKK